MASVNVLRTMLVERQKTIMKWKLVYNDDRLGEAWREYFHTEKHVEVLEGDICTITCDAVVSPANSFGFMDGGLDYALSERFGWDLQVRLQARIAQRPPRELFVVEAIILSTDDAHVPWLISAPTMRVPMRLRQTVNAYLAMKAIVTVTRHHAEHPAIETVAIPGLGTGCGALHPETAALQMWMAYDEVVHGIPSYPRSFGEAQKCHYHLNPKEINLWDS